MQPKTLSVRKPAPAEGSTPRAFQVAPVSDGLLTRVERVASRPLNWLSDLLVAVLQALADQHSQFYDECQLLYA
jgi:hypothetical protein